MADSVMQKRWRPTLTQWVAGSLVIGGFLLTGVSWWFLLLVALGTFGPGILRELGWLNDKDEFQLQASRRAGYISFVTTGMVAFLLEAFFRTGGTMEHPERLVTFFLALLWFTWFFSSLLEYWGAKKTAARTLIAFGSVWLIFTIISNTGSEWTGWAALLLHPLLALPFFAMAWLSGLWPRVAGLFLLAAAGFFAWFFGWFQAGIDGIATDVFVLFLGPLFASGVALLAARARPEEMDEGKASKLTAQN